MRAFSFLLRATAERIEWPVSLPLLVSELPCCGNQLAPTSNLTGQKLAVL
ncbi:MAG: hypothetical protein RLY67_514, partial [Pseudomonadota bacterium]